LTVAIPLLSSGMVNHKKKLIFKRRFVGISEVQSYDNNENQRKEKRQKPQIMITKILRIGFLCAYFSDEKKL
jgi:hypothetical protein